MRQVHPRRGGDRGRESLPDQGPPRRLRPRDRARHHQGTGGRELQRTSRAARKPVSGSARSSVHVIMPDKQAVLRERLPDSGDPGSRGRFRARADDARVLYLADQLAPLLGGPGRLPVLDTHMTDVGSALASALIVDSPRRPDSARPTSRGCSPVFGDPSSTRATGEQAGASPDGHGVRAGARLAGPPVNNSSRATTGSCDVAGCPLVGDGATPAVVGDSFGRICVPALRCSMSRAALHPHAILPSGDRRPGRAVTSTFPRSRAAT